MRLGTKQLDSDELRGLYGDSYAAKISKTPKIRLVRLMPFFELRSTDVVGDFGCGDGMLMEMICNRVNRYYGVDFSQDLISAAVRRQTNGNYTNAQFECNDIRRFCERYTNTFDKAFTLDFSEHIYDEDFLVIYRSIYASLKPGGILYLHTPNADFLIEKLKHAGIMKQFPEHVAVRNATAYVDLLSQVGFGGITVHYLPHYLRSLSLLHAFSDTPLIGKQLRARLLIECSR